MLLYTPYMNELKPDFASLRECAYIGLHWRLKNRTITRAHLFINFYVADVPETKTLLGIKQRVQTRCPCHVRLNLYGTFHLIL